VGSIEEAIALAKTEAKGIGLMRTELLFLARDVAPSLDEQIDLYSGILEKAPAGEVIFRTLDAGSDKPLPYLGLETEKNPSLGVRGFRINGIDDTILKTQLSALAAAQAKTGRAVSVMAPMISTVEEARDFAELATAAGLSSIGVMVETPSICTQIKDLAGVVSFVSLGTNDLSQYLFAADRQNSAVAKLLDPWQPGLLRTIAEVCSAAEKAGIKVGVCGEAASDPLLAIVLVGLGVQSLSMAGPAVARVLDFVSSVTLDQAKEIALASLEGVSVKETKTNALANLP
jgi:phosphotransferase system enzyme I (PtsI)